MSQEINSPQSLIKTEPIEKVEQSITPEISNKQSVNIPNKQPNRCIVCFCGVYDLCCCNTGCYRKDSPDMRCCGLTPGSQDMGCFPTLSEFVKSPLCSIDDTHNPYGTRSERLPGDDGDCCAVLCCPCKFVFTLPCLIGTIFNSIINCIRGTNGNYLC
jgi:hypothetical protein